MRLPCRGYHFDDISPLYPFGYGLSYTDYQYSNLEISKDTISNNENALVTIDVKNIGDRTGSEVVQLYIRDKISSVTRPIKELKDFIKNNLKFRRESKSYFYHNAG